MYRKAVLSANWLRVCILLRDQTELAFEGEFFSWSCKVRLSVFQGERFVLNAIDWLSTVLVKGSVSLFLPLCRQRRSSPASFVSLVWGLNGKGREAELLIKDQCSIELLFRIVSLFEAVNCGLYHTIMFPHSTVVAVKFCVTTFHILTGNTCVPFFSELSLKRRIKRQIHWSSSYRKSWKNITIHVW